MTTQKLSSKCPSNENITTLANHLQLCSWHPSLGNKLFSKWPRARSNDYFSDIDWRQFLAEIFLVFTSHLYVPFDYLSVSFCMIMWESSTRIVIEAFNLHTFSSDKPSLRHCVRHQLVLFLGFFVSSCLKYKFVAVSTFAWVVPVGQRENAADITIKAAETRVSAHAECH